MNTSLMVALPHAPVWSSLPHKHAQPRRRQVQGLIDENDKFGCGCPLQHAGNRQMDLRLLKLCPEEAHLEVSVTRRGCSRRTISTRPAATTLPLQGDLETGCLALLPVEGSLHRTRAEGRRASLRRDAPALAENR